MRDERQAAVVGHQVDDDQGEADRAGDQAGLQLLTAERGGDGGDACPRRRTAAARRTTARCARSWADCWVKLPEISALPLSVSFTEGAETTSPSSDDGELVLRRLLLRQLAGDLLELLRALVGEVHRDDPHAALLVDRGLGARRRPCRRPRPGRGRTWRHPRRAATGDRRCRWASRCRRPWRGRPWWCSPARRTCFWSCGGGRVDRGGAATGPRRTRFGRSPEARCGVGVGAFVRALGDRAALGGGAGRGGGRRAGLAVVLAAGRPALGSAEALGCRGAGGGGGRGRPR